jgi:GNAT superfamily N-acetyltransferase
VFITSDSPALVVVVIDRFKKTPPILEFKQFADLNFSELEQTIHLYSTSFLPVETKRIENVLAMLRENRNYRLYLAKRNGQIVGFSLLYLFTDLHAGLLDYMAVIPSEQRKGIGQAIFRYTFEVFQRSVSDPLGLFLEIQSEKHASDPRDIAIRKDRIRFYKKLGAKIVIDNYLLPPQFGLEPEVTYLMIVPCKKIEYISRDFLIQVIKAIHLNVYRYDRNDLLEQMRKTLPERLLISETEM